MPTPTSRKGLQAFLGALNFHRRFIQSFGEVARPLYELTSVKVPFKWTDAHACAFQELKGRLLSAPALALPDCTQTFVLTTDASDAGIGVTLSQFKCPVAEWTPTMALTKLDVTKTEQVVAYASRSFHANETKRLTTPEKELLGIIYGATRKW